MSARNAKKLIQPHQADVSQPFSKHDSEKPFSTPAPTADHEDRADESENIFVWAAKSLKKIRRLDGDARVRRTIPRNLPQRRDEV